MIGLPGAGSEESIVAPASAIGIAPIACAPLATAKAPGSMATAEGEIRLERATTVGWNWRRVRMVIS
jgi:hypothetical protein